MRQLALTPPNNQPNCPEYLSVKQKNIGRLIDVEIEQFEKAREESVETYNAYLIENSLNC